MPDIAPVNRELDQALRRLASKPSTNSSSGTSEQHSIPLQLQAKHAMKSGVCSYTLAKTAAKLCGVPVWKLVKGSKLVLDKDACARTKSTQGADFVASEKSSVNARVRSKVQEAEYQAMIQDVVERPPAVDDPDGGGNAVQWRHAGAGMSILFSMLATFAFGYQGASAAGWSDIAKSSCGLVCMISTLLVEVGLVLVRTWQQQRRDDRNAAAATPSSHTFSISADPKPKLLKKVE